MPDDITQTDVPNQDTVPEGTPNPEFAIAPEDWQDVQETVALIKEALSQSNSAEQQYQYQQTPQNPLADYFGEDLAGALDQYFDQKIAPLNSFTEEQSLNEAEERAQDIIDALASEKGDLPDGGKQMVRSLANEFIADAQERYGFGPQAAEAALAEAYDHVKGVFETANKGYYESRINELETLGRAPREPEVGAPTAQGLNRVKGDEMALVRSIFQRQS